ncbi:hypothetical protein BH10ACT3_BH10ACT3_07900 [soil metagenome]
MRKWWVAVACGFLLFGCGEEQKALSPREQWREQFARHLRGKESDLEVTDEMIDRNIAFYCADTAKDFRDYIFTVTLDPAYLPPTEPDEVPMTILGAAALVSSAVASDCPGLVDRDKAAQGAVEYLGKG